MVYINLAEATDRFQAAKTEQAIQKAKRAHALSAASGDPGLIALSAVWLAHFEFNCGRYEDAVNSIGVCLKRIDHSEIIVKVRCNTLIADLMSFCGRSLDAISWYAKARSCAVDEGDEIAMGQIIYNSAVFRFNNIRLDEIRGKDIHEELRLVELMIGSSSHYDAGVQSSAFSSLLPMLNAQLLMLRGDFNRSAKMFGLWLDSSDAAVDERLVAICRADFALSLAYSGALERAIQLIELPTTDDETLLPPDEIAIIFHQRARIYAIAGTSDLSDAHRSRSQSALKQHEEVQQEILKLLSDELVRSMPQ